MKTTAFTIALLLQALKAVSVYEDGATATQGATDAIKTQAKVSATETVSTADEYTNAEPSYTADGYYYYPYEHYYQPDFYN